jgi:hypothetical protein
MMWTNYPATSAIVDAAIENGDDVFKMSSPEFVALYKKAQRVYKSEGGINELSKKSVQVNNASDLL